MQIELFREFLTLASSKSYREAADRLFISQSALSRHISELESNLNVQLFDRDTRSVSITSEGARILERARIICGTYDSLLQESSFDNSNRLTMGVPLCFSFYAELTKRAVDIAAREHGGLSCRVLDTGSATDPATSFSNGCDLVLDWGLGRCGATGFESTALCERRLCIWLHEQHPLAERKVVSLSDLEGMVYRPSTSDRNFDWYSVAYGLFSACGIKPAIGEELDALHQLGPNDFAFMFGGSPSPWYGHRTRQVVLKESHYEAVTVMHRRNRLSAAAKSFMGILKKAAKDICREESDSAGAEHDGGEYRLVRMPTEQ